MFRPKKWINPYNKPEEMPLGMMAVSRAMCECFEEGADAIYMALEDIRKKERSDEYQKGWDDCKKYYQIGEKGK